MGRAGGFGSRLDLLAEVSVENDAAAESLYGEALPGNRKNPSDLEPWQVPGGDKAIKSVHILLEMLR